MNLMTRSLWRKWKTWDDWRGDWNSWRRTTACFYCVTCWRPLVSCTCCGRPRAPTVQCCRSTTPSSVTRCPSWSTSTSTATVGARHRCPWGGGGGLGVRGVVLLAPSAYLASAASTAELTSTLLPARLRDVDDSGIAIHQHWHAGNARAAFVVHQRREATGRRNAGALEKRSGSRLGRDLP